MKQNCWEFKRCGREPGGVKVAELGACPAANDVSANGLNSGKSSGRMCWATAGTFSGKSQGTFAGQLLTCLACDFFKTVRQEEPEDVFQLLKPGQVYKG